MTGQLVGPKALTALGAGFATLQFGQTISLTAIIVAALVVVLGGLFTLRNNLRSFWRDLAEERAAQIVELEIEVREGAAAALAQQQVHSDHLLGVAAEQRELRHQLKGEIATLRHQLELETAKHDLSTVTTRLKALEDLAVTRGEMFDRLDRGVDRNAKLLSELVHLLGNRPEGGSTA